MSLILGSERVAVEARALAAGIGNALEERNR